jgi:anthranilate phosphoribosyltransferase
MKEYLEQILAGKDLDIETAAKAMNRIMSGKATSSQIAGFLVALKAKRETVDEVAGLVSVMRERAVSVEIDNENLIDTCGTGGDGSGTFNISTAAAIVTAAAGIKVAKHGNRSVSSGCGSADVLHAMGIKVDVGPRTVKKSIEEIGIGFMFAPLFHPAMKHAMMPRRELGIRTVFNILGPLTNPAGVKRQTLGVFTPDLLDMMVTILSRFGSKKVVAFSSEDGLDELSLSGVNHVVELSGTNMKSYELTADQVGLPVASINELKGGNPDINMVIITDVFNGREGPCLDDVAFNAGAAIFVGGKADSIKEGVAVALDTIKSGKAKRKLEEWKQFSKDIAASDKKD